MKLIVESMACAHCEHAISKAVGRLGGRVRVDLAGGTVAVDDVSDEAAVRAAIEAEGFQVIGPPMHRQHRTRTRRRTVVVSCRH